MAEGELDMEEVELT